MLVLERISETDAERGKEALVGICHVFIAKPIERCEPGTEQEARARSVIAIPYEPRQREEGAGRFRNVLLLAISERQASTELETMRPAAEEPCEGDLTVVSEVSASLKNDSLVHQPNPTRALIRSDISRS